jgi:2-methylisocitrate lyase-like PEP mutase family enzyme
VLRTSRPMRFERRAIPSGKYAVFDLESGYGEEPEQVGQSISLAIEAGSVGCNSSTSLSTLADSGVARVSYGSAPYVEALRALEQAARAISA